MIELLIKVAHDYALYKGAAVTSGDYHQPLLDPCSSEAPTQP